MADRLILTHMPVRHTDMLVCAIFEKTSGRLRDLFLCPPASGLPAPGEIYVGKIERMHRQTDGAFVRIGKKHMVYLPVRQRNSCDDYIMKARRERGAMLRAGDELLLQIDVSAQKTKLPRAEGELNLSGRFLAISTRDPGIHFSKKLSAGERERLRPVLKELLRETTAGGAKETLPAVIPGIIVRTNAAEADEQTLRTEYKALYARLQTILEAGCRAQTGSCIYRPAAPWAHMLDRISCSPDTVIESDNEDLLTQAAELMHHRMDGGEPELRTYSDPSLPLYQLYGLPRRLERLREKRVFLRSGGFLVIEQTEAFVCIDVNSGKFTGKLSREEAARKINLEAAAEIPRQLRLRQLSGTVLVDFINLSAPEHTQELLQKLREETSSDPVKTNVVDMTALGIVEMTREKRYPPLPEQLEGLRNCYELL